MFFFNVRSKENQLNVLVG